MNHMHKFTKHSKINTKNEQKDCYLWRFKLYFTYLLLRITSNFINL